MNDSYRQCQANILKQTEPKIVHKSTKTDSYKHTLIIYYLSEAFSFLFPPFLSIFCLIQNLLLCNIQLFSFLFSITSFRFPLPLRKLFLSLSLQLRGSHSIIISCTRRKRKKKKMHARKHTHAKTKVNKSLTAWFTEDARTEQQRKRNLENKKKTSLRNFPATHQCKPIGLWNDLSLVRKNVWKTIDRSHHHNLPNLPLLTDVQRDMAGRAWFFEFVYRKLFLIMQKRKHTTHTHTWYCNQLIKQKIK